MSHKSTSDPLDSRAGRAYVQGMTNTNPVRLFVNHGFGYSFEAAFASAASARRYVAKHYGADAAAALTFEPQGNRYSVARLAAEVAS